MMTDIVERLRRRDHDPICLEAADEIERLRNHLRTMDLNRNYWIDQGTKQEAEIERLRARLKAVTGLVNEQAEDEGLWFLNVTCSEAYLQAALRKLHSVIEGEVL